MASEETGHRYCCRRRCRSPGAEDARAADGFHICERGVLVEEKTLRRFARDSELLITDESLRHGKLRPAVERLSKRIIRKIVCSSDVASLYQQMLSKPDCKRRHEYKLDGIHMIDRIERVQTHSLVSLSC